jgi:predicted secreted Zn-dependent protease
MKPRGPLFSSVVGIVLAIVLPMAISGCTAGSGRGPSPPSLKTAPNPPWGTVAVDVQYYELREASRAQLRQEIRMIRAASGWRDYGDTQWSIKTNYDFATSGSSCEPTRVDVSLDLHITLPRLRNPDVLSPELRTEWEKFLRALREHEANHKRIAIECAERVSAELAAVGSLRCELLEGRMQSITEAVTSTCHARNADYDLRTGHGASEGATF